MTSPFSFPLLPAQAIPSKEDQLNQTSRKKQALKNLKQTLKYLLTFIPATHNFWYTDTSQYKRRERVLF